MRKNKCNLRRTTGIEPANDGITTHWRNRLPTSASTMYNLHGTCF